MKFLLWWNSKSFGVDFDIHVLTRVLKKTKKVNTSRYQFSYICPPMSHPCLLSAPPFLAQKAQLELSLSFFYWWTTVTLVSSPPLGFDSNPKTLHDECKEVANRGLCKRVSMWSEGSHNVSSLWKEERKFMRIVVCPNRGEMRFKI